jgi:hypothetical protein
MTTELLEHRLHDLVIETPDAGRVSARVLAHTAKRPSRRLPRLTAGAMATLALIALVAYFAPAADTALAGVPVAGDLLRQAGLVNAAGRITSVGAVSTSSGYRITLVGAYADSTRTVLLINCDPPALLTSVDLRDQFGRSYFYQGGVTDGRTGNIAIQFDPLAWPDAVTGARITVHVSSIETTDIASRSQIAGSWTLPATLGVDQTTSLPLSGTASLGPLQVRFSSVGYTPATVTVDLEITGVTPDELNRRIPDGGKGTPAFTIDLIDPNGNVINGEWWLGNDGNVERLHFLGFRLTGGGSYVLRISYIGHGEFERTLTIPA